MNNLSFRDKGISREIRLRALLLSVIFVVSLVFFAVVLNYHPRDDKQEVAVGKLPILSMESMGERFSQMHGYLNEMDGCYMRESLVPVGEKRELVLVVSDFGTGESELSYEIRSLDTERKIAEESIDKLQKRKGGEKTAPLVLSNLIEEGEEYLLVVRMNVEDQTVRYYTRVMQTGNEHIEDCLEFAKFFHETAISGDASALSQYLEPEAGTDEDTLSVVTIHSSLSQVSWKAFEGELAGEPVVRFSEIGDDYAAIIYDYQRYDEQKNLYNVNEYFKVRYTSDRMYLLDYKRTMEEVPAESFAAMSNVLAVGAAAPSFRFLSNDTGTVAAFVQAGELFEYNQNTSSIRRVFSFRGKKYLTEVHANYDQHGIRILDIDENGALDFAVYGYMNGGRREGYSGISLYHYDVGENMAREQAFIAVTRPFPILEASFSELLYKSARGEFYCMMDGTLTRIDSRTADTKEMLTGLLNQQYAVSNSGRYLAWIEDGIAAKEIRIMDLEDESSFNIVSDKGGELLRPMAFLEEDFAYGFVRKSDIGVDAAGNSVYPCYKVTIRDITGKKGRILKEYEKPGQYVSDITSNSYTLFMSRVQKMEDGGYEKSTDDTIQDSSGEPNKAVSISQVPESVKGIVTGIVMDSRSDLPDMQELRIRRVPLSDSEETAVAMLDVSDVHENYYVYVGNEVILASTSVTSAVKAADRRMGVVIDNKQSSIWKRTRASYVNPFSGLAVGSSDAGASTSAKAISAMLVYEGENVEVHNLLEADQSPIAILKSTLKWANILDLTGCSLSEVLYFVNCGSPVYVRTGVDEAVLLVGYDAANVYVYEPNSGDVKRIGLEQAEEGFAKSGNVFISYLK